MFKLGVIGAAITIAVSLAAYAGAAPQADVFTVTNLVADTGSSAPTDDSALVNGWGLSAGPTTPWWVSDNGTNESTLYNGTGAKQALTVAVADAPTGTVFNGSATDFVVTQDGKSGAAHFLFSTEGGKILGWTPAVNGTTAIPGVDRSAQKAVYKGLATIDDKLYAIDFHNNRVDVFDAAFKLVTPANSFRDKNLPKGFAPFGIQALGGNIFVTYALQDKAKHDDVAGGGRSYVDEYTPAGTLAARVASGGRTKLTTECSLGAGSRSLELRTLLRRRARRELRRRSDQRLREAKRQVGVPRAAQARRRPPGRHRRPLGDRVRKRLRSRTNHVALLRGRTERRVARTLRHDHGRLSQPSMR